MNNEIVERLKKYGTVRVQESRLILVPHRPLPLPLVNKLAEGHRPVLVSGPLILENRDAASSAR